MDVHDDHHAVPAPAPAPAPAPSKVVVDQQKLMTIFAERFYVALFDKDDGSDPDYQSNFEGFVQKFNQLTSEMKLTLSQRSGLTKIENQQAFKARTIDQGASWKALPKDEKDQWNAIAKRVVAKVDAKRPTSGWDCYRTFKMVLPPYGDGKSPIPRPSK